MKKIVALLTLLSLAGCVSAQWHPELHTPDGYKVDWGDVAAAKASEAYPKKWLKGPVSYLASYQEMNFFKHLCGVGSLESQDETLCLNGVAQTKLWDAILWQFWAKRDPTPGTEDLDDNEYRETFYQRVSDVDGAMPSVDEEGRSLRSIRGRRYMRRWRESQAMIYILFGAPDSVRTIMRNEDVGQDVGQGMGRGLMADMSVISGSYDFDVEIWYYWGTRFGEQVANQISEVPIQFSKSIGRNNYEFFSGRVDQSSGQPIDMGIPQYVMRLMEYVNHQAVTRVTAVRAIDARVPTREERLTDVADRLLPMSVRELAHPIFEITIDGWDLLVDTDEHGVNRLPLAVRMGLVPDADAGQRLLAPIAWELPLILSDTDVTALLLGGKIKIIFTVLPRVLLQYPLVEIGVQELILGRMNNHRVNLMEHNVGGLTVSQPLVVRSELSLADTMIDVDAFPNILISDQPSDHVFVLLAVVIVGDVVTDTFNETTLTVVSGLQLDSTNKFNLGCSATRNLVVVSCNTGQTTLVYYHVVMIRTDYVPDTLTFVDRFAKREQTVQIRR